MAAAIDPHLGQYPRSHPRSQPSLPPPNGVSPLQSHPQLPSLNHARLHQLPPIQSPLLHSPPYQGRHLPSQYQDHHLPQPARLGHDSPPTRPYYAAHHLSSPHQHSTPPDRHLDDDSLSVDDPNSPNDASVTEDANGNSDHPNEAANAKRPRACDSCRGLKVKCIIDSTSGEPCKRCTKAGRQCIVTPPTRKRQKKADGRVAELERKIDALTATLAQRDGRLPDGYSLPLKREYESYESGTMSPRVGDVAAASPLHQHKRPRLEKVQTSFPRGTATDSTDSAYASQAFSNGVNEIVLAGSAEDPQTKTPTGGSIYNQKGPIIYDHTDIDHRLDQIISRADAERLFNRYVEEFVPQFPAVPFPPGTTAQQVRSEKPILFLSILSGTSYGANVPDFTQVALEKELRDVLATCMWKNGERSLQLVQALQVTALWYRPPANFEQHMFYQMVHMATIMAIDIGIGKRENRWKKRLYRDSRVRRKILDPESIESRRAWLVNYFLCITIAMILRRPILLRFNDYLRDCLDTVESSDSEGSLPSDKALCQHINLARVSEDIAVHFAMDDPAVSMTISEPKVSYGIKHHEQALADLRNKNMKSPSIQLSSHVTNLYLHEIALHSQNNVEDFKAPFTEETFRASVGQIVLGPGHVDALLECQSSCKNVVETFLGIDFDVMFVLPVVFSVRIIYAVIVLIKLHIAATTPGEMSNIIHEKDLRLDEYLEKLESTFRRITEKDRLSPHTKFLYVIQRLIERYHGIKTRAATGCREGQGVPSSPHTSSRPGSAAGEPPLSAGKQQKQQAQGLHLLSEVAMNNHAQAHGTAHSAHSSPSMPQHAQHAANNDVGASMSSTAPAHYAVSAATGHLVSHAPQSGWYQQGQQQQQQHQQQQQQHHAGVSGDDLQMPLDLGFDYQAQLGGLEGLDFGLHGLGVGVDGAINGLFMESGPLWGMQSIPGTFMGGWPG